MQLIELRRLRLAHILLVLAIAALMAAKQAKLKVGDDAPDFTAKGIEDESLSLSDFEGKKNVVVVFNRAHW